MHDAINVKCIFLISKCKSIKKMVVGVFLFLLQIKSIEVFASEKNKIIPTSIQKIDLRDLSPLQKPKPRVNFDQFVLTPLKVYFCTVK